MKRSRRVNYLVVEWRPGQQNGSVVHRCTNTQEAERLRDATQNWRGFRCTVLPYGDYMAGDLANSRVPRNKEDEKALEASA